MLVRNENIVYSAFDIANYILKICYESGDVVTNMKLQKLLYYAQAWYLVRFGKPLFEENILAWQYGPVIYEVYEAFKNFGGRNIILNDYENDEKYENIISEEVKEYLRECCGVFLRYSATDLMNMTHNEDPWKQNYQPSSGNTRNAKVIPPKSMEEFYRNVREKSNRK